MTPTRRQLVLAAATCTASSLLAPFDAHAQFQKGMNLVWWGQTIEPAILNQSLDNMAAVGVDHVAVNVFWFQDNINSTQVAPNYNLYSPNATTVEQIIDAAHQRGLAVMLRPVVDLANDSTHWRGQITGGSAWFNNAGGYGDFIRQMADVAQAKQVELFSVGAELEATAAQTADWQGLVSSVRSRYSGSLTYGANWGNPAVGSNVAWWNDLDYVGIDAYYPLTNKTNPTFAELQSAWLTRANQIESWRNSVAPTKPVLFTEAGYMAMDGTNMAPYSYTPSAPMDQQEQADAYRALLSVMMTRPWFAGSYFWAWDAVPNPDYISYKPEGKLAVDALAEFYVPGYMQGGAWTGAAGNAWNSPGSWSDGSPPGNLTTAHFTSAGNAAPVVNLTTPLTAARLVFDQAASAYTFNGPAITFNNGGGVTITDKVTTTQTINSDVKLGGVATVFSVGNASARLNINGGISAASAGANRLSLVGPGGGALNGTIGNGAGVVSLFKGGAGTWTLSGSNTYTGSTDIAWGTVVIANNNALGSTAGGTNLLHGASLVLSPNLDVAAEPLTISGTGVNGQGALQRMDTGPYTPVTWNGQIALNGSAEIHNRAYNNPAFPTNVLVLAGDITGGSPGGVLNLRSGNTNPGFFRIAGANNGYLGNTHISGGKVILAGGDDTLPTSTVVTLDTYGFAGGVEAGVLDLNGNDQTIAGLASVPRATAPRVKNDAPGTQATLTIDTTGNHAFAGSIRDGAGTISLAKVGPGTQTLAASSSYSGATTVTGGVLRVQQSAGADRVLKTGTVTVSGDAKIDVANNKIVVTSGDVGSASAGVYTGVTGLIQSAHNGGTWDGPGIATTMPDAATGLTTLAVAAADQTAHAGGTFGDVSVSATDVLIMYTYAGDANLDGLVSGDDYSAIDFNISVPAAFGYASGDFNYDGIISGDDYSVIDFNIFAQGPPIPTAALADGVAIVPEPAQLAGLLSAALLLSHRLRRHRRHR